MADETVVAQGSGDVGRGTKDSAQGVHLSSTNTGNATPSVPQVEDGGDAHLRRSLESQELSQDVANFLLDGWRHNTRKNYRTYLQRWYDFCVSRKTDPLRPPVSALLEFLLALFHKGKKDSSGLGYSSLGVARSAISQVAVIDGKPAGQHPLVHRFMRSVYQRRPALPRYRTRWDPDVVLEFIRTLGPNEDLHLLQLSRKLTMLFSYNRVRGVKL